MALKARYYVVWRGRKPGIYDTWKACEAQVKGFTQAEFKAFPTRELAEKALRNPRMNSQRVPAQGRLWDYSTHPPITGSISVDAACAGNPGKLEWQGVHTASGKALFRQGPFANGTNNIGEFLAIVHALSWLKEQRNGTSPVYTDSTTAIAWVKAKRCKTTLRKDARNAVLFKLIAGAERWLAENPYENRVLKWDTGEWGQIPADFGRK